MKRVAIYLTIALGLAIYVMILISIGAAILPDHWAAQLAFYGVTGIIWIFPVMWIITFFHKRNS
ncbi:DUF2842 domain-containing protein [Pelagibius sp. Alg239-R121]|uniref:DUF2842 domain-containing protein n=1 Tax=Pelagibius sp. Alg239-R121 TaxID=2993448 RepID=UPI0024A71301|nr:DUF2842 domain-containing protein [Pelagibius sp. Alg239-R121]